jgi:hypothetical protein
MLSFVPIPEIGYISCRPKTITMPFPTLQSFRSIFFHHCKLFRGAALVTFDSFSKLLQIEDYAFCNTALVKINIPASVESIGERCFYGCAALESMTFEMGAALRSILAHRRIDSAD